MKLKLKLLVIFSLLLLAGCAPRYLSEQPTPRKSGNPTVESFDRMQEIERDNRELRLSGMFKNIKFYLGTPYEYGGDSRRGMDCSGFVSRIFEDSFSIQLPRSAAAQYAACVPISRAELTAGDLVFFLTESSNRINHVGIYLGLGYFAHASTGAGVVITSLTDEYYQNHYYAAGRILD